MALWNYTPLLILCFIPNALGTSKADRYDETVAMETFTPHEDVATFHKRAQSFGEGYGNSWIVMPDGNGTAHVAVMKKLRTLTGFPVLGKEYAFKEIIDSVNFYYYRRNMTKEFEFKLPNANKLNFDPSKPTKFIVHGWRSGIRSSIIKDIKDAYLAEKDVNVFGVDWSPIAADPYYPNPAGATSSVGKALGILINTLVTMYNASYSDIHIIGHSLGAHISGFAGDYNKGKVGRITGLDPALPGFQEGPVKRLDDTDARFVDIIHTCSGVLGIASPIGHVDFYPNGGSVFQPGCANADIREAPQACSHARSILFFTESISQKADFEGIRCHDWTEFKENKCGKVYAVMGENIPLNTQQGVYYLKTNKLSPFAKGRNGTVF